MRWKGVLETVPSFPCFFPLREWELEDIPGLFFWILLEPGKPLQWYHHSVN